MRKVRARSYYVADHTVIKCHQAPTYRLTLSNRIAHYVVNAEEPLPDPNRHVPTGNEDWAWYSRSDIAWLKDLRKKLPNIELGNPVWKPFPV